MKIGSDESHYNVSLIVRNKVTRQRPQTTTFEEKGEPKRIRSEIPPLTSLYNALPLSQTGSLRKGGARKDYCIGRDGGGGYVLQRGSEVRS